MGAGPGIFGRGLGMFGLGPGRFGLGEVAFGVGQILLDASATSLASIMTKFSQTTGAVSQTEAGRDNFVPHRGAFIPNSEVAVRKKIVDYGAGLIEVDDWYEENNPEEYVLPIVDHYKLLTPEKGGNVQQAISDLSSRYFIQLRNKYKQSPIGIQQQAASQESVDNMKAGRLRPTLDGLGENKTTQQDANVILGLFSPFRYHIPEYEGYDIKFFKDNIRFLEILGGREGGAGTICPLYFNGAVNYFKELPKAKDMTDDTYTNIHELMKPKL